MRLRGFSRPLHSRGSTRPRVLRISASVKESSRIGDKNGMNKPKRHQQAKRNLGYIRVSSSSQAEDGESLARQEAMIRAHCQVKGIGDIEIITDAGVSGFKSTRPGFQRLVKLCQEGHVGTVIVYDLSRLSRSVRDTLAFVEDIVNKHSITFVSLAQDVDTSTPIGKAFLGFTSIFNQLYRDEISYKTRVAIMHKKNKGERYCGEVPYGLMATADGHFVKSESDEKMIVLVRELRDAGLSLRAIGRRLEERGYRTKTGLVKWNPKTIRSLMAVTGRAQNVG